MNAGKALLIAFLALLAGCANPLLHEDRPDGETLTFDEAAFGDRPDIIAVNDIYRLSDEQEAAFRQYFDNPAWQDTPVHERVWSYLQEVTTGFDYQGETYTAEEALSRLSGNCLSLAVLTTALADLAGVDTVYHLVDSAPVFETHGHVVFRARHVRTKLLSPERPEAQQADELVTGSNLVIRGGLLVDYFPRSGNRFVGNVDKQQYQAMFYNNLAGEAIARGDYNRAFWLLREALDLKPDDAAAINAMAIVHRRTGQLAKAGEIYRYGIENLDEKVSLLRNYRVLLEQQGLSNQAKAITRSLALLDDPNPLDWLYAGHQAFADGKFEDAVFLYRRALQYAPYLHEGYAGLGKAYYMTGDLERAEGEFQKALHYSGRASTRTMYEAKLMALGHIP